MSVRDRHRCYKCGRLLLGATPDGCVCENCKRREEEHDCPTPEMCNCSWPRKRAAANDENGGACGLTIRFRSEEGGEIEISGSEFKGLLQRLESFGDDVSPKCAEIRAAMRQALAESERNTPAQPPKVG